MFFFSSVLSMGQDTVALNDTSGTGNGITFFSGNTWNFITSALIIVMGIYLLRHSTRVVRYVDNLWLRLSRKPNLFDGYHFAGKVPPFSRIFRMFYFLLLGRKSLDSFLTWPLKYYLAAGFFTTIALRFYQVKSMEALSSIIPLMESSIIPAVVFGFIAMVYLVVTLLVIIESIKKVGWMFPARVIFFTVFAMVILLLFHAGFWLVVIISALMLLSARKRDYLNEHAIPNEPAFTNDGFIYEPWEDGAVKD